MITILLNTLVFALSIALVFCIVVVVHEAGHFIVAKMCGIRVDEFSVGFGPKLFSRKRGETEYAVRAIPAGGFVRMPGMLGLEGEADAGERNFYRASIPKRAVTILAGIVCNFLFGALCFTVVAAMPIASRLPVGEASYAAGLRDGDVITQIGGISLNRSDIKEEERQLRVATHASQGNPIPVTYLRSGASHQTAIQPELIVFDNASDAQDSLAGKALIVSTIDGHPIQPGDPGTLLGSGQIVKISGVTQSGGDGSGTHFDAVSLSGIETGDGAPGKREAAWRIGYVHGVDGLSLPAAVGSGFSAIPAFISDTATGIVHLIVAPPAGGINGPSGFTGPVGIAVMTVTQTRGGVASFLNWVGFLSMNLGFINLLPIPFLDGGRLLFVLLEGVRRKRVSAKVEAISHVAGLAVLVVFALYITVGDFSKIADLLRSQ